MSATQDTAGPDVQIVERYADDDEQATMYAVIVNGDPVDEFITREEADAEVAAIRIVTQHRRETALDDGARICAVTWEDGRACISINASLSAVHVGVLMSREQLAAHRDAINAVLAITEA